MKNANLSKRPIWLDDNLESVSVIDQRRLPHEFSILSLESVNDIIIAIKEMVVRGAPLIGVTGAFGVMLSVKNTRNEANPIELIKEDCEKIITARPTAVNLSRGVERVWRRVSSEQDPDRRLAIAREEALKITEEEVDNCRMIGLHGVSIIEELSRRKEGRRLNILTHCNAGWLACVEYGTATAPIYVAAQKGMDVHVWVDETRPLNQGSRLTAWELGEKGVKHTVIPDNTGGHLMQHGLVDLVIVGTDRTTYTGDVANKIGTYLKALAAKDNGIPFYVALPSSTFDWETGNGIRDIPIEERDPDEVRYVTGLHGGRMISVLVPPKRSAALNIAFDVTPARLVTGFITERGVCRATEEDIRELFPHKSNSIENEVHP